MHTGRTIKALVRRKVRVLKLVERLERSRRQPV